MQRQGSVHLLRPLLIRVQEVAGVDGKDGALRFRYIHLTSEPGHVGKEPRSRWSAPFRSFQLELRLFVLSMHDARWTRRGGHAIVTEF